MPMLKICTPPPDMYSMKACMGNDLSGEIANSHAFFFFSASCELNASTTAAAIVPADDDDVVVVATGAEEEDLPCPLPCIGKGVGLVGGHFGSDFDSISSSPIVRIAPLTLLGNPVEQEACYIYR